MKRNEGVALIASLIVMAVLMAVGLGSMFLAQMNLGIAQNTRVAAIARNSAESGLDTMLVYLAAEYANNNAFPATKSALDDQVASLSAPGFEFTVADYQRYAPDRARVAIRGTYAARNAEHVSEALVRGVLTPTNIDPAQDPAFGEGLVTDGMIYLPGNANLDINLHAGGNIDITGGASSLAGGRTARAAGEYCGIGRIRCQANATPPTIPEPNFEALRQGVMDRENTTCSITTTIIVSRSLICLPPNANITIDFDITDVTIIGDESTTVNLNGNATDVTVVSGTLGLGNTSRLEGTNSLIAKNDIEFTKYVTSNDDVARTFIVSEGNILIKGNGRRPIYASFWAGNGFRINGAVGEMVTTVVAMINDVTVPGIRSNGINDIIRPPDALINPDVPVVPPTASSTNEGLQVVSRR